VSAARCLRWPYWWSSSGRARAIQKWKSPAACSPCLALTYLINRCAPRASARTFHTSAEAIIPNPLQLTPAVIFRIALLVIGGARSPGSPGFGFDKSVYLAVWLTCGGSAFRMPFGPLLDGRLFSRSRLM